MERSCDEGWKAEPGDAERKPRFTGAETGLRSSGAGDGNTSPFNYSHESQHSESGLCSIVKSYSHRVRAAMRDAPT